MPTRDVPRDQWPEFLESFSREHRAWLATVEPRPSEATMEPRPLSAVLLQRDGGRVSAIEIQFVADSGTAPVRVEDPTAVRVGQTADGADRALEITDATGERTRVRFRATARPEMLDGVAPGEVG